MIIPPFYSVPTDDELFDHYKKVSDAISIPIMVYNNPATANVDMMPELIARHRPDPELQVRQGIDARSDARARHHPPGRRQDDGVRRRAGLRIVLAGRRGLGRGVLQRHPALVGRAVRAGRRQARHGYGAGALQEDDAAAVVGRRAALCLGHQGLLRDDGHADGPAARAAPAAARSAAPGPARGAARDGRAGGGEGARPRLSGHPARAACRRRRRRPCRNRPRCGAARSPSRWSSPGR